jgi:Flp pilus assembly protein TadD
MVACTNTTSTNTDKEEYYVIRGMNYSQEGKTLEALREFEKAYGKNNENIITVREMALAYAQLADYEKSEEFYKKALALDPRDQASIKNLALLNYVKKDYDKADEYLESVSKDSIDTMVLKLRGFILFKNGDADKAYTLLKNSMLMEDGLDMEFYNIYSQVLLKKSKYMELYRTLEYAYEKYPEDKNYIIFYTRVLANNYSEYDKAEQILKRYVAVNGTDDVLLLQIAKISMANGDVLTAENSIKMISDKYKYDIEYLNLKKDVLDKTNRTDEAEKVKVLIKQLTKENS